MMRIASKLTAIGAMAALFAGLSVATPAQADCDGCGAGIAAGIIGGAMLGAAIANSDQPHYYRRCWIEHRAIYDEDGDYLGRRRVRVCR